MWSTAPTTPTNNRKLEEDKVQSAAEASIEGKTSYEKAILLSDEDKMRVWQAEDEEKPRDGVDRRGQLPKHISSSSQGINSSSGDHVNTPQGQGQLFLQYPSGVPNRMAPEVVSANHSATRIHRGFVPNSGHFDATKPTDLPGSRGEDTVITTPPHSQTSLIGSTGSRPRAQSIEEADRQRENYAPLSGKNIESSTRGEGLEEDLSSFCLGLTSLIINPDGISGGDRIDGKEGKMNQDRKVSETSDASTVSVSTHFCILCTVGPLHIIII